MIERVIFHDGLPQLYEITLSGGAGEPIEPPTVMQAQLLDSVLDSAQTAREDLLFDAAKQSAEAEAMPGLNYSMRLMRPKETRQYWRSTLHNVIRAASARVVTESPAYKRLIEQQTLALGTVIMMNELEPAD